MKSFLCLFWNWSDSRFRAAWRLILQAAIMIALALVPIVLIAEPLTVLHRHGLFLPGYNHEAYDRVVNMIVGPLLAVAVIGSIAIAGRWLDHRRFEEFGARLDGLWWKGLGLGLFVGAIAMTAVFVVQLGAGWVVITDYASTNVAGVSLPLALSFSAVKVLCVGTYEEFLSRGYHLRNLIEATNLPMAVIGSSAVFSILHLFNDNATAMSTAGLFVNGLLFAAGVLATGRLSTAIGLHISWNLFEGMVFGFPVSGDKEGASIFVIRQLGSKFITGGDFGPEAGLIGIAASLFGVVLVVLLSKAWLRTHPWSVQL